MRKLLLTVTCVLAASLATSSPAIAEDEAVFTKMIETKADAVVSVKFVLDVKVSRGGQVLQELERAGNTSGVVVDSAGLVMIPGAACGAGGRWSHLRQQFDIATVPSNIRVVFPGDTREYDAVLGAKDSKLGLAFVLIKDLGDRKATPLDMEATVEPRIGQALYGVSRLDQGFDHAPMTFRARVAGSVTKPRTMWIVQGATGNTGKPLFDAAGALAGIVVTQRGVGDDSSLRPFLLPLKVAMPTIATALENSKEELDRILEEEEEAAAEAAEAAEGAEETPEGGADAEKGDEGKKDEPKKDEPKKDEPKKDEPKKDDQKRDDGAQDRD